MKNSGVKLAMKSDSLNCSEIIYDKFTMSRLQFSKISMRKYILFCLLFSVVFHVLKTFGYISMEFIFHRHPNVVTCPTCSMTHKNEIADTKRIPDIIHQIYFPVNSATPSEELQNARNTWIMKHPRFTHYFWKETDVQKFIRAEYPHLLTMYESYTYWVWRVNIARYLILFHFGGWYTDLDLICTKSVDDLTEKAFTMNKSVVQHLTFPVGTSNDFIGITKEHQFLKSVLDFLPNSDRQFIFPYPNTVLRTGTTYVWGRYLNYPYQDEFLILSENEIKAYFINEHASTWHGWDALIIRFVINHLYAFIALIFVLLLGCTLSFYSRTNLLDRYTEFIQRFSIYNNNNNNNNKSGKTFQIL